MPPKYPIRCWRLWPNDPTRLVFRKWERALGPLASPRDRMVVGWGLAEAGVVVVNARVRAASDGVVYPVPVEDVLCALAFGVARADVSGVRVGQLFIFGHSSGAHLAALGSLQTDRYSPSCLDSLRTADGLIGLSGLYDVDLVSDLASSLFGAAPRRSRRGIGRGEPDRPGPPSTRTSGALAPRQLRPAGPALPHDPLRRRLLKRGVIRSL
jgi:acetyl esterase/lipase